VVSFNNEGYFDRATIEALLRARGEVVVIETDFKRYVGAQIGIYSPSGIKVGAVSHLRNKEYLYVATRDARVVRELQAGLVVEPLATPAE
jgi:adenine-specific DNA-methyltransferase